MERDARLAEIARILRGRYGDLLAECWLWWPNPHLGNRTPRDALLNFDVDPVLDAARKEAPPHG